MGDYTSVGRRQVSRCAEPSSKPRDAATSSSAGRAGAPSGGLPREKVYSSSHKALCGCGLREARTLVLQASARFSGWHRETPGQRLAGGPDCRGGQRRVLSGGHRVRARAAILRPHSGCDLPRGDVGPALEAGCRTGVRGRRGADGGGSPGARHRIRGGPDRGRSAPRDGGGRVLRCEAAAGEPGGDLGAPRGRAPAARRRLRPHPLPGRAHGRRRRPGRQLPLPHRPRTVGGAGRTPGLRRASSGAGGDLHGAQRGGPRGGRARARARTIDDDRVTNFYEALAAGYETAQLSPTRRRALEHLELYANAGTRIDLAVINTRVLARGAANVLRRGDPIPPLLPEAVQDLARAVRALATYLEETRGPEEARRFALEAARKATEILKERHDLAISVLVGQIRSAAVDLLRSTGMDQASALQALEETAGRASEIG